MSETLEGPLRVEVHSDVVCPWCWVGKVRLERAVAQVAEQGMEVELTYRPYQLHPPRARDGPAPPRAPTARRSATELAEVRSRLDEAATELGIELRWEGLPRRATLDAHRALTWALSEGGVDAQAALKGRLLRAHFTEHLDIEAHDVLADLAAEVGLDRTRVAEALASGWGTAEVASWQEAARAQGITAVPTVVVEREWTLPGALETARWVKALTHMAGQRTARP